MIESFVDLTYRSLPLGRRVKLTQVRPTTGYLEMPTPMPVGTRIALSTDEGVGFDAVVTYVHEQVGGSDRLPGMTISPALGDDKASSWWSARVALPELPPRSAGAAIVQAVAAKAPVAATPRVRRTAEMPNMAGSPDTNDTLAEPAQSRTDTVVEPVRSRTDTVVEPVRSRTDTIVDRTPDHDLAAAVATVLAADRQQSSPVIDDGVRTTVMQAIDDPALLDQIPADQVPAEPVLVDDGKKTIVMEAVDVRALGLEPSSTGEIPVVEVGDDDSDDDKSDANGNKSKSGPSRRRRGKKR